MSFLQHTFAADETYGEFEFIDSGLATAVAEPAAADISETPQMLRQAGVGNVILVHGTFAGNDIVGLTREIARLAPGVGAQLSELGKRWFDELVGELGNYAESFENCLKQLINRPGLPEISVTRFHWSGENHHLGRADGMMMLLETLLGLVGDSDSRCLILAHSHGGNVVAMLSQLLSAGPESRRVLFQRTRLHYRNPITGKVDLPIWKRIEQRLCDGVSIPRVDVASFGTPLRYRWNSEVIENLLHFVHHRPLDPEQPERATIPTSIQDVLTAAGGDYVQHLGIAGTDFLPPVWAVRDWIVQWRAQSFFEPGIRRRDLIKNLKLGRRASCDGKTLLVDYAESPQHWNQKLFGHGVYTCSQWLPFHLKEIGKRFYGHE